MIRSHGNLQFRLSDWSWMALVILAGIGLRFMQFGAIRYTYDQSYSAFQAVGLLDAGIWPIIGQPSSVFLDNPPLMVYLQMLPLLLVRNPQAVQIFILILNTTGIWFVWRVATEMLGRQAGWMATFLFAISPWVVYFSRMTWVQSLVPFFMPVIAWGLWPVFVEEQPSPRRFFIGGLAVTAMTQTYIQAWGVLPQIGLLILFFRGRVPRRAFWAAMGIFLAAALLYGVGLARRSDVNSAKAVNFVSEGWQGLSAIGLRHAVRFVNGIDFLVEHNPAAQSDQVWLVLSSMAVILATIFLAAGILRAGHALGSAGRNRRVAVVLLVWFLVPVALTTLEGAFLVHPHYLLLTLPAGHILAAWGLDLVYRGWAKPIAIILLLFLAFAFGTNLVGANQQVIEQPTMPEFDGWSLSTATELGRAIREVALSDAASYPRRIVASGNKETLSGLSATYLQTIRGASFPDYFVLSATEPVIYLIEDGHEIPTWLQPFIHAESARQLEFSDGKQVTVAKTLPANDIQNHSSPAEYVEWPSDTGLTFVGYTLSGKLNPGGVIDLLTYWRVDDVNADRAEWFIATSYHLVDTTGGLIANVGAHGQWAHRWELGDTYVEHMQIPVPVGASPGGYILEVGLFDSVQLATHTFLLNGEPFPTHRIPIEIHD